MLTPLTLTAISVLRHISSHETGNLQDLECGCKPLDELLGQLESAGLIRVRTDQSGSGIPKTYELTRPLFRISLLDLMEAVDHISTVINRIVRKCMHVIIMPPISWALSTR